MSFSQKELRLLAPLLKGVLSIDIIQESNAKRGQSNKKVSLCYSSGLTVVGVLKGKTLSIVQTQY